MVPLFQISDIAAVATLASWAEPWRRAVSHSAALSTSVLFVHLGALVCAGGFSLTADYATLRVTARMAPDTAVSIEANDSRRIAGYALLVLLASGVALFLSDVAAFADMAVFWLKMGLVAVLLVNAVSATRLARRGEPAVARRRLHAALSIGLWFTILALGTVLMSG